MKSIMGSRTKTTVDNRVSICASRLLELKQKLYLSTNGILVRKTDSGIVPHIIAGETCICVADMAISSKPSYKIFQIDINEAQVRRDSAVTPLTQKVFLLIVNSIYGTCYSNRDYKDLFSISNENRIKYSAFSIERMTVFSDFFNVSLSYLFGETDIERPVFSNEVGELDALLNSRDETEFKLGIDKIHKIFAVHSTSIIRALGNYWCVTLEKDYDVMIRHPRITKEQRAAVSFAKPYIQVMRLLGKVLEDVYHRVIVNTRYISIKQGSITVNNEYDIRSKFYGTIQNELSMHETDIKEIIRGYKYPLSLPEVKNNKFFKHKPLSDRAVKEINNAYNDLKNGVISMEGPIKETNKLKSVYNALAAIVDSCKIYVRLISFKKAKKALLDDNTDVQNNLPPKS